MAYRVKRLESGVYALFNPQLGETMHPGVGPWEEANRLYVEATGLSKRLRAKGPAAKTPLTVFDVGLGGAANALAALAAHRHLTQTGQKPRPMKIVSFENDLEPLEAALDNAQALSYPLGWEEALRALLTGGKWNAPGLTWRLRMGDFTHLLDDEPERAEVVFFDPFSPKSNPVAWSVPTLRALLACRPPGGEMIASTYSSSVATRAAFFLAGFYVGKGPQLGQVRGTTVAASRFPMLEEPLDRHWLGIWRRERDPWPKGSEGQDKRLLRQALLEHPQWEHFPETGEEDERPGSFQRYDGQPHNVGPYRYSHDKPGHKRSGHDAKPDHNAKKDRRPQ